MKTNVNMYTYYIGLGSNLGDRHKFLDDAVQGLCRDKRMKSVTASSWYDTPPWGNTEQGRFLNGVVKVVTELEPEDMLVRLHELEQAAGRTRAIHWGPRTLDLDIVWAEQIHSDGRAQVLRHTSNTLVIPHPYFWERLFVLQPLAELYPTLTYQGVGIAERIKILTAAETTE